MRFFVRSTEERGENPRRRNGTVNVGKEAFGAKVQPLAKKAGKAKATRAAIRRRAQSQDIRFRLFLAAFQPERMQVHKNVCTKAKKWLWCFFILTRRSGTAPILYSVKNDKL